MPKYTTIPAYLKKGDRVLIISPSSKIDKKIISGMRERLKRWGLIPIVGKHATAKSGTFAGTIKQRLTDLQFGLDNKKIKAIFCSRGGFGAIQLLDYIDLRKFLKHPKWVIGYSDITALHSLVTNSGIASLHAPMARQFALSSEYDLSIEFTKKILFGDSTHYIIPSHKYNHKGVAKGILVGGNLTVIQSLLATEYIIKSENIILFIEDTNISANQVERLLFSILHHSSLSTIKAIIIGEFCFDYPVEGDFCKINERIQQLVKDLKIPIVYNFPVGHGQFNYPLICGIQAEITVKKGRVDLIF